MMENEERLLMFTEMVNRKIQQLEEEAAQAKQDQVDCSLCTRFRKRINAILRHINIGLKSLRFKPIEPQEPLKLSAMEPIGKYTLRFPLDSSPYMTITSPLFLFFIPLQSIASVNIVMSNWQSTTYSGIFWAWRNSRALGASMLNLIMLLSFNP